MKRILEIVGNEADLDEDFENSDGAEHIEEPNVATYFKIIEDKDEDDDELPVMSPVAKIEVSTASIAAQLKASTNKAVAARDDSQEDSVGTYFTVPRD